MILKGFNQSLLAKEAKVSKENLNRLLKGHRSLSKANILPDIAKALGVSVEQLKSADVNVNQMKEKSKSELILAIQSRLTPLNEEQLGRVLNQLDIIFGDDSAVDVRRPDKSS
jgi:transcriptional regulator with XRE-family HTH domain